MLGNLYYSKARSIAVSIDQEEFKQAKEFYRLAQRNFEKAYKYGLEQRPPNWSLESQTPEWTDAEEDDFRTSLRMIVLIERNYGNHEQALLRAKEFYKLFPDDAVLDKIIQKLESESK